jgi:hypothetical protein
LRVHLVYGDLDAAVNILADCRVVARERVDGADTNGLFVSAAAFPLPPLQPARVVASSEVAASAAPTPNTRRLPGLSAAPFRVKRFIAFSFDC